MDEEIIRRAESHRELAIATLREAIRLPADVVDLPPDQGGDPSCGLSNHERPRVEYFRRRILELGAVDSPGDITIDGFGNLVWRVEDPADGVPPDRKTVILYDGHTDTVHPLRPRWHEAIGGGIDAYEGLIDLARVDRRFLTEELGYLPPESEWPHLVWGRGSADQLGGVVSQIFATKILRELRPRGALRGVIVKSYATVAEEDNDGGGPMYVMQHELAGAPPGRLPDVVILTEGTGSAKDGALGIYRGQRGRMQIEVVVTGRSCHGSMPWEGKNPLEHGAAIIADAADRHTRGEGFAADPFLGPGSRTASLATLETPSDCAVPQRFTFRFDRRLVPGEDPDRARVDIEMLPSVARAREAGLQVEVRVPVYSQPTWKGYVPGNRQIYPGWVTPEDHPAIRSAVDAYRRVVSPLVAASRRASATSHLNTTSRHASATPGRRDDEPGGAMREEPRVSRWTFSTDGVGIPVPVDDHRFDVPPSKRWVTSGPFRYPPMFGIGPGIEQNTHKIGECVDSREIVPVIAFLACFPALYHRSR